MGRADFLRLGDWNVVCWQSGFKCKASQVVRNWQGYYVLPEFNEPRQPQDFVKGIPDNQTVPFAQVIPSTIFAYNQTPTQPFQGDGVNKQFQLGDGLYVTSVTAVYVNGTSVPFTANSYGLITTSTAPIQFAKITASGTETVPHEYY
jgi:hypothetical protein